MIREPLFVWKDAFTLGVPSVDAEHRQFFEIMNRCARAAAEGGTPTALALVLKELATYADHHFKNEEAALDRVGYPELPLQRAEHRRFIEDLARLEAGETANLLGALALMRDWLMQHILGNDRRYVTWIEKERPGVRWC